VKVKQSLDAVYGLDEEALKAMKQWQFKPGTKNGEAVAVRVDVKMRFTLK
jgi:TonB family protein